MATYHFALDLPYIEGFLALVANKTEHDQGRLVKKTNQNPPVFQVTEVLAGHHTIKSLRIGLLMLKAAEIKRSLIEENHACGRDKC